MINKYEEAKNRDRKAIIAMNRRKKGMVYEELTKATHMHR